MSRRSRTHPPFSLFAFQDIIAAVTGVMVLLTLLLALDLVTRVAVPTTGASPLPSPTPSTVPATAQDTHTLNQLRTHLHARLAAEPTALSTPAQRAIQQHAHAQRNITHDNQHNQAAALRLQRDALVAKTTADTAQLDALTRERDDTRNRLHAERLRTRVTLLDGQATDHRQWFLVCDKAGITAARLQGGNDLQPVATFPSAQQALPWATSKSPAGDAFVLLVPADGISAFNTLQRGLLDHGFNVGWDLASPALLADLGRSATHLLQGATP